jgi:serine/threonine protein phosphatase 1
MRILAIGDIHGHLRPLQALLEKAAPRPDDLLIFAGDYVDKGPDVKGVIDCLLDLSKTHRTVFLRGNHDQMLLDAHREPGKIPIWECLAGENPLASYGRGTTSELLCKVPAEHWAFLAAECRDYFEAAGFIFVHGGIRPHMAPADEDPARLQWTTLADATAHHSRRTIICGHSPQQSGHIADLGHTIGIDTNIANGGWLSCLALDTFEFWQTNSDGESRSGILRNNA